MSHILQFTFEQIVCLGLDNIPNETCAYVQQTINSRFQRPRAFLFPSWSATLSVLWKATWPGADQALLPAHLCCSCRALASALGVQGKMYFKTKANSHTMPLQESSWNPNLQNTVPFLKEYRKREIVMVPNQTINSTLILELASKNACLRVQTTLLSVLEGICVCLEAA